AIVAAAELSARYITGRQLPDKAVDLLDTACARVKVLQNAKPDVLEDTERRMQALAREKKGLQQDADNRHPIDPERLAAIDAEHETLGAQADALRTRWQSQQQTAQALVQARRDHAQGRTDGAEADALQALEQALIAAETAFAQALGDQPLVRIDVEPDVVAKVVSDWTGVPVGKMQQDQARTVLGLAESLKKRIRGQDLGLDAVAAVLKTASSGVRDPQQPLGVFLLVGPSGVGKTETALAIADQLFGDEKSAVVVNMSEFQERHNVSRLIGSPPGYVGYGEGGMLTEAVRQRPYSVVLLDEVEKAHLDVLNLFYQVFDKGMLSDGEGKEIDFSNTVIFLTSNLATDVITEMTREGDKPDLDLLTTAIRPLLSAHFKPALLARMTIVPYMALDMQAIGGIVRLKLDRIVKRLAHSQKLRFTYDDAVVDQIAARCTEVETGARNVDFILRAKVLPLMSQQLLERMGSGETTTAVHLFTTEHGEFDVRFESAVPAGAQG
ncbi:MAG: AAA family ATPase, partial [Comamonadaceae bacterium]